MALFGRKRPAPRPIVDLDMALGDEWHQVDYELGATWVDELTGELAQSADECERLAADLERTRESRREMAAKGWAVFVMVRPDSPDRVLCTMQYGVSPVGDATPEAYKRMLEEPLEDLGPETEVQLGPVTIRRLPAGPAAVGARRQIHLVDVERQLGVASTQVLCGVFPTGSSDAVEFIFETTEPEAFDDFIELTAAYLSSLAVTLEAA